MKTRFGSQKPEVTPISAHMLRPGNLYWFNFEVPTGFKKLPFQVIMRTPMAMIDLAKVSAMSMAEAEKCRFLPFESGEQIVLEQE